METPLARSSFTMVNSASTSAAVSEEVGSSRISTLAVCGDRLGDLNQLHLGNAQGSELGVRIIIQMDFLQDLGRILIHFVMVDNGDGSVFLGGIAPNVDILAYGASGMGCSSWSPSQCRGSVHKRALIWTSCPS